MEEIQHKRIKRLPMQCWDDLLYPATFDYKKWGLEIGCPHKKVKQQNLNDNEIKELRRLFILSVLDD